MTLELETCPDCEGVRGFLHGGDLTPAALHIAYGVERGGWCCDHVEWTWEDAANAYAELYRQEMRWRDQLRAALPPDHPAQMDPNTRRMREMAADG